MTENGVTKTVVTTTTEMKCRSVDIILTLLDVGIAEGKRNKYLKRKCYACKICKKSCQKFLFLINQESKQCCYANELAMYMIIHDMLQGTTWEGHGCQF